MGHDQFFKDFFRTFFRDFLDLFYPETNNTLGSGSTSGASGSWRNSSSRTFRKEA